MNTLFKSKVSRKSVQPGSEERIPKTIEIKSISHGWAVLCVCHDSLGVNSPGVRLPVGR